MSAYKGEIDVNIFIQLSLKSKQDKDIFSKLPLVAVTDRFAGDLSAFSGDISYSKKVGNYAVKCGCQTDVSQQPA